MVVLINFAGNLLLMQQNLINILNIDFNVILQTLFDDLLFDEMGNCFRKSKHKISVTEEIAFFNHIEQTETKCKHLNSKENV